MEGDADLKLLGRLGRRVLPVEVPIDGVGAPLYPDNVLLQVLREAHLGVDDLVVDGGEDFAALVTAEPGGFTEFLKRGVVRDFRPVLQQQSGPLEKAGASQLTLG